MDFDHLNAELAKVFEGHGENRRRLITYALDENIFPASAFKAYPGEFGLQPDRIGRLKELGYVTQLFWIRSFFEYSSGNDPFQALEEALFLSADYRGKHDVARNLPFPFENLDELLEECWLVGGGEDHELRGRTSKLTRTCAFLTRNLSNPQDPEVCWEEIDTILDTQQPDYIPAAVNRLIEARDPDFLDSLLAIHSGLGMGWLQRVCKLRGGVFATVAADADWMLYRNGNLFKLMLTIRNIFIPNADEPELSLRQGGRDLFTKSLSISVEKHLQLDVADLLMAGLDVEHPLRVRIGTHTVATVISVQDLFQINNAALFRYPLRSKALLLPRIAPKQHVSARRVVLLSSEPPDELTLDGHPLHALRCAQLVAHQAMNLWEVCLEDTDSTEPQVLRYQSRTLAFIGRKPWIEVSFEIPEVSLTGGDSDITLVSGTRATVKIRSLPAGEENTWKVDGQPQGEGGVRQYDVVADVLGHRLKISCGSASAILQFLPPLHLWGDSAMAGAYAWSPEQSEERVISNAERGVEEGILTVAEGKTLSLERPLRSVCWWWKEGVFANGTGLNQSRTFLGYSELFRLMLCVCVPDEELSLYLSMDGGKHIVELQRLLKGSHTLQLGELVRGKVPDEAILDAVDELMLDQTKVAEVLRAPDRPTLTMKAGKLYVFFPETDHNPESFSLLWASESDFAQGRLRVAELDKSTACGQLSEQSVPEYSGKAGVWCLLVRNDLGELPDKIRDLGYDPLPIEHAVCIQHSDTSSSLAERIGIESNSAEAGRVRQRLDVLPSLEWEGLNQWGVFAESIRDKDGLAYANRDEAWKEYFLEHCALEKTKTTKGMLVDTLSLLLRSGYNWCAEPHWFQWASEAIPASQGWQKGTKNRKNLLKKSLKSLCPMLRPYAAIQAGFPVCDQNQTSDFGHLERICRPPSNVLMLETNAFEGGEELAETHPLRSRHNHPVFGREGIWVDGHNLPVTVKDGDLQVSFGNRQLPFRIVLDPQRSQHFVSFMRGNHIQGQDAVLSGVLQAELWELLERKLHPEDPGWIGRSGGLGDMIMLAIETFRNDDAWLCRAECLGVSFLCRWFHHQAAANPGDTGWTEGEYTLLTKLTSQLHAVEETRPFFFEDLIEMDWLIRWFLNGESN